MQGLQAGLAILGMAVRARGAAGRDGTAVGWAGVGREARRIAFISAPGRKDLALRHSSKARNLNSTCWCQAGGDPGVLNGRAGQKN